MRKTTLLSKAVPVLITLACAAVVFAGKADPVYKTENGLAIRGYDPVAYFDQSQPVKGSPQFTYQWMGATWLFASQEHRDRFASSPDKYAPQFGGYCAYAVSQGHTASIDPEAWKIVDGKLYLNYSKGVQKKWEQDVPGYIQKGISNWPNLHN